MSIEGLGLDVGAFVVADAAGMGNKIACGHRPLFLGKTGTISLDRDIEVKLVLFHQFERGGSGHRFADGGRAVSGVGSGLGLVFHIGVTKTFGADDFAAESDSEASSRGAMIGHGLLDESADLLDVLDGWVVGLFGTRRSGRPANSGSRPG